MRVESRTRHTPEKGVLVQQYIIKRILFNIPVVFLVITVVFMFSHLRPDFAEQRAASGFSGGRDYQEALNAVRA